MCPAQAWWQGSHPALFRGRRAALYSAVLYVASTQLIAQAQSVRMYTLLGFLSAISLWLFVRVFVNGEPLRRLTWGYVAVGSFGVLTQIWFAFLIFGQLVYLVLWRRERVRKFLGCNAAAALVFLSVWGPAFLGQLRSGAANWLPPFHPIYLLDILVEFYGREGLGLLFLLICAIPVLIRVRRGAAEWSADAVRLLAVVLAACLFLPLLVSTIKPIYYPARYSTVALPVLASLLGGILAKFASRRYALLACTWILIASTAAHIRDRNQVGDGGLRPGQNDRTTAEYILQHAAAGDCIVFTNLTRPAADYYFRRAGRQDRFVEINFPEELSRHPGWLDRKGMLRNPDALREEAVRTAGYLAARAAAGEHIWVYDGLPEVSEFLKSKLDAGLVLAERHNLQGPFHKELLVYAAPLEGNLTAQAVKR